MTPDVTDDMIMTAVRSFLLGIMADGVEILQAQQNRVPEPASPDFIILTPTRRMQLGTTTHAYNVAAGTDAVGRSNSIDVQADVYGPNSNDNAQVIATLFRDAYGCEAMAGTGVQPLYCEDGQQMPLVNGEYQYQDRWTLRLALQANPAISTPMQFAPNVRLNTVELG